MDESTAALFLPDNVSLKGIVLRPVHGNDASSLAGVNFRYLTHIDPALIPLRLISGSSFVVTTTSRETEDWFSDNLLSITPCSDVESAQPWWSRCAQSPTGVLAAVLPSSDSTSESRSTPLITEIAFYASRVLNEDAGDASPRFELHALPLSSALLKLPPTPPQSPPQAAVDKKEKNPEAQFLPPVIDAVILSKRKIQADEVFASAVARNKKARRHGGESVAAAAAASISRKSSLTEIVPLGTKLQPSTGGFAAKSSLSYTSQRKVTPIEVYQNLRKSESRPSSRRSMDSVNLATKEEDSPGLDAVASKPMVSESSKSIAETKNRDLISRLIMAGMRMYGLKRHSTKSHRGSVITPLSANPGIEVGGDGSDMRKKEDSVPVPNATSINSAQKSKEDHEYEEYKMVYHQTMKAAVFAFRRQIDDDSLHSQTDLIQDTVDKLLTMFCSDPLIA